MPSLTVNKIRLERVEDEKESSNSNSQKKRVGSEIDLKEMCFWMGRDLENVERENREMKRLLDEMKMGISTARKEMVLQPNKVSETSSGELQRRRSYKSGRQEDEKKCSQTNRRVWPLMWNLSCRKPLRLLPLSKLKMRCRRPVSGGLSPVAFRT
ncbi:hypothetical protein ACSQ67_002534 [Phaseolus vulgaris]